MEKNDGFNINGYTVEELLLSSEEKPLLSKDGTHYFFLNEEMKEELRKSVAELNGRINNVNNLK